MGLYSKVMGEFTPDSRMRNSPPYLTVCSLVQSGKEKQDGKQLVLEEKEALTNDGGQESVLTFKIDRSTEGVGAAVM